MKALALDLDGVLGDTRPLWEGWLADAARRYAAIAALDPASLPLDRGRTAVALDRWAAQGIGDWGKALERYAEEHAPLHLRPDPTVADALRELQRNGVVLGVFTDAPERLARVALAHLGASRRIERLETGAGALERLLDHLGPATAVARSRADLLQLRSDRSR